MTTVLQRDVASLDPDGQTLGRRERNVFVHPSAICETAAIGDGTKIWAFAHILDGATIGRNCSIADHAYVQGGARIGDRVTIRNAVMVVDGMTIEDDAYIGPGVIFTNDRHPRSPRMPEVSQRYMTTEPWLRKSAVRCGATVGAGAVILPGIEIGAYATVGAGAVVTHSVPPHRLVAGNPAQPIGWVCLCGMRVEAPWVCKTCGRRLELCGDRLRVAG